jgi:hypothetical protein
VWLNVASDSLFFFAYFSISIALVYFFQKRQDLPFKGIVLLVGAFILSCGTNYLIEVWAIWYPIYWTFSFIKAVTAGISACTAVILVPIIPKVLANLSPAQLELANCQLKAEIFERRSLEEKLRSSQQMLQLVMDNIPQSIFWKDRNSVLLGCNCNFAGVAGVGSPENIVGKTDYDLPWKKEDTEFYRSCDARVMETDTPEYHIVEPVLKADGKQAWVDTNKVPLHDSKGNVVGILGTFEDITDRKQTQEALHKQREFLHALLENLAKGIEALKKANEQLEIKVEERTALLRSINEKLHSEIKERVAAEEALRATNRTLQTLLQASPIAIGAINSEKKVTMWNPAAERLFGWSEQEVLGCIPLTIPEDEQNEFRRQLQKEFQGEAQTGLEVRRQRKDGSLIDVSLWTAPLFDSKGAVIGSMAMFVDLSERVRAEQALRESKEQLQALMDNSPAIIYLLDARNRHLLVNRGYENLVSMTNEQLLGKSIYDVWPHDIADAFAANNQTVLKVGTSLKLEELVPDNDELHTYLTIKFPLRDANGVPYAVWGISTDITERKQAEEALRESEARYRRLIETAAEGIWILDAEGNTTFANAKIAQMLGYTVEEMSGMPLLAFTDAQGQAIAANDLERRRQGVAEQLDFKFRRKDGSELWTLISTNPIFDNAGQYVGALGMLTDITERKAAEEALLGISKAVESSSDAIGIADRTGRSIYHNLAFINLLEYTVDELNAAEDPRVIYADPTVAQKVFASLMRGNYWNGEVELRSKSDRVIQVSLRADAIKDHSGQIIGLIGIHTDITERKQAEETLRQSEAQLRQKATQLEQALHELQQTQAKLVQSEKMSSLGQLVAGVAHEINNPLSFIHGNLTFVTHYAEDLLNLVQLYQEYYPNPAAEIQAEAEAIDINFINQDLPKVVSAMKGGADRISQIVLSLRNFSRVEQAEKKWVDIHEGLDSTLMILAHRLKAKFNYPAIQVIKEYGNLPQVLCYPGLLNQAFMNILINAIDALEDSNRSWVMGHGEESSNHQSPITNYQSPRIQIRTEVLDGNQVMIRIADNGSGMREEVQRRVFDPFFTTKSVGHGTGLGLSISYQIVVEKHGGQLQCLSTPCQGTEFLIYIPNSQLV